MSSLPSPVVQSRASGHPASTNLHGPPRCRSPSTTDAQRPGLAVRRPRTANSPIRRTVMPPSGRQAIYLSALFGSGRGDNCGRRLGRIRLNGLSTRRPRRRPNEPTGPPPQLLPCMPVAMAVSVRTALPEIGGRRSRRWAGAEEGPVHPHGYRENRLIWKHPPMR